MNRLIEQRGKAMGFYQLMTILQPSRERTLALIIWPLLVKTAPIHLHHERLHIFQRPSCLLSLRHLMICITMIIFTLPLSFFLLTYKGPGGDIPGCTETWLSSAGRACSIPGQRAKMLPASPPSITATKKAQVNLKICLCRPLLS